MPLLRPRGKQLVEAALSRSERKLPQVFLTEEQQIESEKDQVLGLSLGQSGLERRKARYRICIERDHLAIDQTIGKIRRFVGNRSELGCPVESLACSKLCATL